MAIVSIQELQSIIAQGFFGGDTGMAGILMYSVVLMLIFLLFAKNNIMIAFILTIPVSFIFTTLGVLPEAMAVLLIILAGVGIAKERVNNG